MTRKFWIVFYGFALVVFSCSFVLGAVRLAEALIHRQSLHWSETFAVIAFAYLSWIALGLLRGKMRERKE
jgi:threonine/homoserine/homoserine lactone efflux protein